MPIREGLSPEQYLRSQIHRYYLVAFLTLCLVVVVVFTLARPVSPQIRKAVPFNRTFQFSQPSFNISAPIPPGFGGFTSLGHDTSLHGKVKITKIRMTLEANSKSNVGFADVWAFLGPQAFTCAQSRRLFPEGPATFNQVNTYPWDLKCDDAPTQVKLACGRPGDMPASATFSITFDFTSHKALTDPLLDCNPPKSELNDSMSLENGLYVQLFIWTGFTNANIDIGNTQMRVEGIFLENSDE